MINVMERHARQINSLFLKVVIQLPLLKTAATSTFTLFALKYETKQKKKQNR